MATPFLLPSCHVNRTCRVQATARGTDSFVIPMNETCVAWQLRSDSGWLHSGDCTQREGPCRWWLQSQGASICTSFTALKHCPWHCCHGLPSNNLPQPTNHQTHLHQHIEYVIELQIRDVM